MVQYGYAGAEGADVNEIVDRAQAETYHVTERRTAEDFVPLEALLQPTMDEIDAIASNGGPPAVPTGHRTRDELTNGPHGGQMIVIAVSVCGNRPLDSISCDPARSRTGFPAWCSLEMSKSEIVMRLLSAEAKIKLAAHAFGLDERRRLTRLARRMSEDHEAPLISTTHRT